MAHPPSDQMWAAEAVSEIRAACPERDDLAPWRKLSLRNDEERTFVLDKVEETYGEKRAPEQPLAALDNGAGKKPKVDRICRDSACKDIPQHDPDLCPNHFCKTCGDAWNKEVTRTDGRKTPHGNNCPKKLKGACAASAIAKRTADTAARKAASAGLADMAVARPLYGPVVPALPVHVAQQQQQQQQEPRSPSVGPLELPDELVANGDFSLVEYDSGRGASLTNDESAVPGSPQKNYEILTTELELERLSVDLRELEEGVNRKTQNARFLRSLNGPWIETYPPIKIKTSAKVTGTKKQRTAALKIRTIRVMYDVAKRDPANRVGPVDLKKGIDMVRGGPYVSERGYGDEVVHKITKTIDDMFRLCTTCHRTPWKECV